MLLEIPNLHIAPNAHIDWIFSIPDSLRSITSATQFIGFSTPAIGVTLMWGQTGSDRDGHPLGGIKVWYTINPDGSAWKNYRMLVEKQGGSTEDYFSAQFNTF